MASRELGRLREGTIDADSLDRITIHCLGRDSLPSGMVKESGRKNHTGKNDPRESVVLIVKPTDYDSDPLTTIPGDARSGFAMGHQPTLQPNIVDELQSLLFQTSASAIPAVVLSPRLSKLLPLQSTSTYNTGSDSSTYGGIEPEVGPTSWLQRDLVPPVYAWVGCASVIGRRTRSHGSVAASLHRQQCRASCEEVMYFSRVALTQSAMEAGHRWHMFAVQEGWNPPASAHGKITKRMLAPEQGERHRSYHYIGSSIAARGRPSSRIMYDVLEDYCSR